MKSFFSQEIRSWQDFLKLPHISEDAWVYRGQSRDWQLKTSLERACEQSAIDLRHAPAIEEDAHRNNGSGFMTGTTGNS